MFSKLKQYFVIIFGAFFLSLGLNVFLVPQKISTGGISSIATILKHLFNVPLSLTIIILNGILFLFGVKILGKKALIKTVLGIVSLSLFLEITSFIPIYREDMLASSILGGILVGIGLGLVIRQGASTGGSDFLALMLYKYFPHISIAKIILTVDIIIVSISALIFKSVTVGIYSLISLFISSKLADGILIIGDRAKTLFILSDNCNEIAAGIMEKFQRGVTGIKAKGMYKNRDNTMLLSVVTPKEVPLITEYIKKKDANAFIIINDAHEVFGEGFKIKNP
ncbi:MAG: YitT family protein [Clostridiales bacterium]|nr:YitT family protein [Clostridiales bacterium]